MPTGGVPPISPPLPPLLYPLSCPSAPPPLLLQVARIARHRHLPTPIYKAAKLRRVQTDSERRKTQHRIAHSALGAFKLKPARKKKIVAELE